MKIIVTGGAGFIGSNFLHWINKNTEVEQVMVVDSLTYAGHMESIQGLVDSGFVQFIQADINQTSLWINKLNEFDLIFNFAAESHVDNSIASSQAFIDSNIVGVHKILEALRNKAPKTRLIQISTDEVYGSLGDDGKFLENDPLKPSSPYSASKAAADLLVLSFVNTYGLDAVITRSSNNYGPYQFPEKFVPVMVTRAQSDLNLPIYGTGKNVRDWIYVDDNCEGVWQASQLGSSGEIYNLGGGNELTNLDFAKKILNSLKKPNELIEFVTDRPGHDFRYAVNCKKSRKELNWAPKTDFSVGLDKTINWYQDNMAWVAKVTSKIKEMT